MSGIIGTEGSKSGVIGRVGSAVGLSIDSWRQNGAWHSSGTISGATRALAASNGMVQIGSPWTQSSGEFTPPFLGVFLINAMFTFYEAGDNNNDNTEGSCGWYDGSAWKQLMIMRVGHQYDGTYTRGSASNSTVANFTDSSHKIKIYTGSHTSLDFAMQLVMTYLGK